MTRAITYLGRKFIYCMTTAGLVLIGSLFAKPENFAIGSGALVSLAGIFCYGNVKAGLGGLPGPSAQDKKDGADADSNGR